MDDLMFLLSKGYILYRKCDTIESIETPKFGEVVIKYRNDEPYQVSVTKNTKL